VTKRYPDGTVAVDELDLVVAGGRITVFVGPSSCGKTTSLRMINRMIEPTSGTILLDGKDIQRSQPAQLRRGIGYVIQHAGLFPHRTVLENVITVPLLVGAKRKQARAGRRTAGAGRPASRTGHVFVTHDIDEAIKLGDRVAVFRVGGTLAQRDSPSALLAKPADDFVSAFVGRDRGWRTSR